VPIQELNYPAVLNMAVKTEYVVASSHFGQNFTQRAKIGKKLISAIKFYTPLFDKQKNSSDIPYLLLMPNKRIKLERLIIELIALVDK
jgi:hypothetical protein